ncbi:hypothetical protein FO519_008483 [Halicephalobus sp. NKZ332]|nr:hypothetical protein FO519_008483 [Halicephalobus sp. NKZ332]
MMLLSSANPESSLHSMPDILFHSPSECLHPNLDENVNERDYCKPSTSYRKVVPTSPLNSSMISDCSFSSPSRYRGSTRDAIGLIWRRDDFEIVEHLGEGFFGNVYKVRALVESDELPEILVMKVAKILNEDSEAARLSAKRSVTREASVLLKLKHENILGFCGLCIDRDDSHWSVHLLVDFCDRGSLQSLILSTDRDFPWLQRCLILMDVANAMRFVNSRGYMHRDLTSMNILLQSLKTSPFAKAVVADFGLSSKIPNPREHGQQVGTQNYMSPEMLLEKPYNEKSDIFSFGIIACQMIARIDADHDAGLYRTQKFGLNYLAFAGKCPSDTPLGFLSLAFQCCKHQPQLRPSFQTIYETLHQLVEEDLHKWDLLVKQEGLCLPEEVRFGRSHSDAAIRAESSVNTVSAVKATKISTPVTIPEGIVVDTVDEQSISSSFRYEHEGIRKIAQSFADEEPEENSKNPFHNDARIRSIENEDEQGKLLPMDSHCDSLKKISMTFALGIRMNSYPDESQEQSFSTRMPPRRHTVMHGFHQDEEELSEIPCDVSETSTTQMRRIESFEQVHDRDFFEAKREESSGSCSWSSSMDYEKHPEAIDTVINQAPAIPRKKRICSFASYPEEMSKTSNLKKKEDESCAIL